MIDHSLSMARHGQEGKPAARPRVLILGGSAFQVPIIRYAKEQCAYVITCDYLPENPGHVLADEYYNVSTTDRQAVLNLARGLDVDAVLSFASEPALQTVSYVAEALGLPGPSLSAVMKLTDKGLFRSLLREAGLPVPMAVTVPKATPAAYVPRLMEEHGVAIPCIVKPVDSSGSKGITVLDETLATLPAALEHAFAFSRSGECIIEQYIEGDQIHGDGYLEGGKLAFHYLGDHVFFTDGGCRVPISTRWPTRHEPGVVQHIASQVETIASVSGYRKGPANIEARVTSGGAVYIIEVSPRNGGNHVPIITQHLTGFDFIRQAYCDATGEETPIVAIDRKALPGAHYVLHSSAAGILEGVAVSDAIRPHLLNLQLFKREGELVPRFRGSNASLGIALLSFASAKERDTFMDHATQHMALRVSIFESVVPDDGSHT